MCIASIAWNADPRWRLIVAANRDETHARPALDLARWQGAPHVLAGRDALAGGTWLGVSERGRFVLVTNVRGVAPPNPGLASRGTLVADMLRGAGRYAEPTDAMLREFNPFNIIAVRGREAWFLTNQPEPARRLLPPGIIGVSNGALDNPWPKTRQLNASVAGWIAEGARAPERLLDALVIDTPPSAEADDGGPIFIRDPLYGTRCSTIVAIDAGGRGMMIERRFDAAGKATGETRLDFACPV